jgi:hypothetical protein
MIVTGLLGLQIWEGGGHPSCRHPLPSAPCQKGKFDTTYGLTRKVTGQNKVGRTENLHKPFFGAQMKRRGKRASTRTDERTTTGAAERHTHATGQAYRTGSQEWTDWANLVRIQTTSMLPRPQLPKSGDGESLTPWPRCEQSTLARSRLGPQERHRVQSFSRSADGRNAQKLDGKEVCKRRGRVAFWQGSKSLFGSCHAERRAGPVVLR